MQAGVECDPLMGRSIGAGAQSVGFPGIIPVFGLHFLKRGDRMKNFVSLMLVYMRNRTSRRNLAALMRFLIVLALLVVLYSVVFHVIMEWEGRQYSWVTGVYWTLTVMSTLGFGDITFHSDLGLIFSILVLMTGLIFLLVLLPFTFIEFFYEPWMEAQKAASVPTILPEDTQGHVLLTKCGPIARALIERLNQFDYPYAVIAQDSEEAQQLHAEGIRVIVGPYDDPDTYRRARADKASLIASTRDEVSNTSVAVTVRAVTDSVPIVALARRSSAVSVLKLSGCTRVLELGEMMGRALARRASGGTKICHVVGRFDELLIAEANAGETPLAGKTLGESNVRSEAGVNVVGIWERGTFEVAGPTTQVDRNDVLLLAGSQEQLDAFDGLCKRTQGPPEHAIIVGGGRVGRAVANALDELSVKWKLVEAEGGRIRNVDNYVLGDATEPEVLIKAGLGDASTIIITTRDDDTNIYLAIFCRKARPDIQIICRSSVDRNIATMHRVGCDFVLSYSSMGANAIFNLLKRSDVLMVAEGLDVFKMSLPKALEGRTLAGSDIRQATGCNVIAIDDGAATSINPDPEMTLVAGMEIVVIGTVEAENKFLHMYT